MIFLISIVSQDLMYNFPNLVWINIMKSALDIYMVFEIIKNFFSLEKYLELGFECE